MEGVKKNRIFIKTYGCQMNFHDSGLIEDGFLKNGFDKAGSLRDADIVILNTCSVRENADHKIVSEIGRLKGDKKIVLTGCFAKQIKLKKEKGIKVNNVDIPVDYCFSPDEILSIPEILADNFKKNYNYNDGIGKRTGAITKETKDDYQNFNLVEEYFYNKKVDSGFATIKIIEGCNNFCSYCIVPFVRGKERSIPFEIIYSSAKRYADKGVRELLLLGQNVNSYLSPEDDKKDFSYMLESLTKIDGIKKIKFLTSHPKDFNDKLIELIASNDKISKSIHLPVQSGSDRILSAMNRGYIRRDYLNLIEKLRKKCPDAAFSTDIIVGFPTETKEDFNMTLSLIDEAGFDFLFGFKYSPRPFTKALEFKDDISLEEKKERLEMVFEKQKKVFSSILNSLRGKRLNVTITAVDKEKNPVEFKNGILFKGEGLNDRTVYIVNKDKYKNLRIGDKRFADITYIENNRLYGEVI
ncbi:MAG: tRNA (N6-isopentenyl adenosine(37)-C2)-methylthiotransferase MiaB [Deltaproteobacteria bacterium]|nr:tRNA (N6-isopentenyl adenosine(37)-C2)-methylthiotransferase MiaB [Deltaproteobacteria bacterium]MCL5892979.1 tRNA (N6-isopentenyl adenosine(37)-C2)-methylthiotransferase MiaB [Deltaproteobacteria bacterium]